MEIRRVVPNISSSHPEASRDFYLNVLGFKPGIDLGFIATFVSPSNPTAQISIARGEPNPITLTVEVADVDEVHRRAVAKGLAILYPLTDEPWGVRRFSIADPNGTVLNVMSHHAAGSGGKPPGVS